MPDALSCNLKLFPGVATTHEHFSVLLRTHCAGIFHAKVYHSPGIDLPIYVSHYRHIGKDGHTHVRKRSQEIIGVYAPVFGKVYTFVSFQ